MRARDGSPRPAPRWVPIALLLAVSAWALPVSAGLMNPATPFDQVLNLWPAPSAPQLARRPGAGPALVVLQHGLWRSRWSLWRLERALRAHGYDVLNCGYDSTRGTIQEHAAVLAREIARWRAQHPGDPPLAFIGHSLGGLVIRAYLARPDAAPAQACVFLGTPQRGASLVEMRRSWALFQYLMGDLAALQLSPLDPIHRELPVPPVPCATVIGARGTPEGWNRDIPGDDDGTVAVAEARLPAAADELVVRMGHTRLSFADEPILAVLQFLAHGRFDH